MYIVNIGPIPSPTKNTHSSPGKNCAGPYYVRRRHHEQKELKPLCFVLFIFPSFSLPARIPVLDTLFLPLLVLNHHHHHHRNCAVVAEICSSCVRV